jgi:hypothetical protein
MVNNMIEIDVNKLEKKKVWVKDSSKKGGGYWSHRNVGKKVNEFNSKDLQETLNSNSFYDLSEKYPIFRNKLIRYMINGDINTYTKFRDTISDIPKNALEPYKIEKKDIPNEIIALSQHICKRKRNDLLLLRGNSKKTFPEAGIVGFSDSIETTRNYGLESATIGIFHYKNILLHYKAFPVMGLSADREVIVDIKNTKLKHFKDVENAISEYYKILSRRLFS